MPYDGSRPGFGKSEAGPACSSYRPHGVVHAEVGDYRDAAAWHAACESDGTSAGGTTRDGETITRLRYGVRKD